VNLLEYEFEIPAVPKHIDLLSYLAGSVKDRLPDNTVPVRLAVTRSSTISYHCEVGALTLGQEKWLPDPRFLFRFMHRGVEATKTFNVMLLVPTGVGAEIGGHAGDAAPVARLLAGTCDRLITHPNVVNASDINEIPENALYVEGSVICRLLMGTVGLQTVRANRVMVVIDAHQDPLFVNSAINSVNAARASYGLQCPRIVQMDPPIKLIARYASSGRAAGRVEGLERLIEVLDKYRDKYDAVAISSVIDVPREYHMEYFQMEGAMVNPWGGVEAMLTHAISSLYDLPSAHSPMFESREIANMDPGIVDPRMAAEAVSLCFLQCVLKGLHRSPRLVTDRDSMRRPDVISAADVSCLVIPDGCIGLPTLAALEQGIPVIAVRDNRNRMRNELSALPWAPGQLQTVENYLEAVGAVTAIKEGISLESVRRPLQRAEVEKISFAELGNKT